MSDINLDFTVNNNSIQFTVEPNELNITPTDVQLIFNPSYRPNAAGSNTFVQYNLNNDLAGDAGFTYNQSTQNLVVANLQVPYNADMGAIGNIVIGHASIQANALSVDVSNLEITGGLNGYFLQTDGAGNLAWVAGGGGGGGNGTPGGSNTQIQYNDNGLFGGNTGFTFNEVTGNVAIPGNLSVIGNIVGNVQTAYFANYATVANSVAGANVSGYVANATHSNVADVANSVAVANVVGIGNIATINLTGSTSNILYGNGVFAPIGAIPTSNFANYAGNITVASQPNITAVGNLVSLTLDSGNVSLGANAVSYNLANSYYGIAIGYQANAGNTYSPIAIGDQAYASNGAISIGKYAGKFLSNASTNANYSIAIGWAAGYGNNRGNNSIAIGQSSGIQQRANSIAMGYLAGQTAGNYSIAIGSWAGYGPNAASNIVTSNNSITLNATGANLENITSNSFVVKPIRNATQTNYLYYDPTSGEITYNTGTGGNTAAAGSNTQIQFNTSNLLDASANFTFNSSTNTLTVAGSIAGTSVSAGTGSFTNLTGRLGASSSSQPNITTVGTLGNLSVTSTASFGGNTTFGSNGNNTSNFTGPVTIGNTLTGANLTVYGTIQVGTSIGGQGTFLYDNGNIKAPGNYTSQFGGINVGGSIQTSGVFIGSGANLTNLNGANVTTEVYSANIVTNPTQSSITAVGTLGNLSVSGNLTYGTLKNPNNPSAATSTTPTHKIPIILNGVTYYICLTTTI